jgi:hypothetical protein
MHVSKSNVHVYQVQIFLYTMLFFSLKQIPTNCDTSLSVSCCKFFIVFLFGGIHEEGGSCEKNISTLAPLNSEKQGGKQSRACDIWTSKSLKSVSS